MRVLGISNGHDTNVALVDSGKVLAVLEKERFTREKHATGPAGTLIGTLFGAMSASASIASIDLVAVVPPVWSEYGTDWSLLCGSLPRGASDVTECKILVQGHPFDAVIVPHHLAHASYAFFSSGLSSADVLTTDAGGGFCDASLSTWTNGRLARFVPLHGFHLGSIWSVTAREVFGDIFGAGRVMGLAGYGEPSLLDVIRDAFVGRYADQIRVSSAWEDPSLLQRLAGDWRHPSVQDLAASVQALTNELLLDVLRNWATESDASALCLGGGVALNGYTNTFLRAESSYATHFFPNAPHDGSLALGAAWFASSLAGVEVRSQGPLSPFLGLAPDGALEDASCLGRRTLQEVANCIAVGGVVGICQGRAELGPRALGHRSIIASPLPAWMRDYLNSTVKCREPFRPIGPALLRRDAATWLEDPLDCNAFMTQIGRLSNQGREALGSISHIDGTVRAQLVEEESILGQVALELEKLGHPPVMCNTSLNGRGEPLVNSGAEAIAAASKLRLDGLLIGGQFIRSAR